MKRTRGDERMKSGTVKWFSKERGYGFLAADEGGDIFVHQSNILKDGFRFLETGQRVGYQLEEKDGKVNAINVFVVNS